MIPYITEEVWQLLNRVATQRGLPQARKAPPSIMTAPWPVVDEAHRDETIERQFARFETALRAVREIRSRQNIAPKKAVNFSIRTDAETCQLLQPMQAYFDRLANAQLVACGPDAESPATVAAVSLPGMEILVDLTGLIDVSAELARNLQQEKKLLGLISGKEKKLANANFVSKAPADVVQRERDSLVQLQEQLDSVRAMLAELQSQS
jgi:valyl-tRNA synthetase